MVELVSPSTRAVDSGIKLTDYFRIPSLRHYLVVNVDARAVTHHCRGDPGELTSRIVRNGPLVLDPPGITVTVEDFFAPL